MGLFNPCLSWVGASPRRQVLLPHHPRTPAPSESPSGATSPPGSPAGPAQAPHPDRPSPRPAASTDRRRRWLSRSASPTLRHAPGLRLLPAWVGCTVGVAPPPPAAARRAALPVCEAPATERVRRRDGTTHRPVHACCREHRGALGRCSPRAHKTAPCGRAAGRVAVGPAPRTRGAEMAHAAVSVSTAAAAPRAAPVSAVAETRAATRPPAAPHAARSPMAAVAHKAAPADAPAAAAVANLESAATAAATAAAPSGAASTRLGARPPTAAVAHVVASMVVAVPAAAKQRAAAGRAVSALLRPPVWRPRATVRTSPPPPPVTPPPLVAARAVFLDATAHLPLRAHSKANPAPGCDAA